MAQENKKTPVIARFGALIAGSAILLGGVGVAATHSDHVADENARNEAQVQQLQSQLASLETSTTNNQEVVSSEATGMSPARKHSDDENMKAIMKQALTWSNGNEYISARQALIDRWHLDETSQFLTVFMPGEDAGAWRTDSSGKTYFAYEGANSSLDSFTTSVTNVDGTKYTYFAVVGITTKSSDGKATSTSYSTMRYTLDSDGSISDITGWAGAPGRDRTY